MLLEVLQKAGLTPTAKRTREGILVTVPDTETEEAHRVLVANMDTIARAARAPSGQRKGRGPTKRGDKQADRGSALASERMTRMARPLGLLLIGLLLVATIGLRQPLIAVIAVGVVVYLIGRRAQQQGGDDRDGR